MNNITDLAQQAAHELKHLRQRNQVLEAQMEIVHIFGRATAGVQSQGQGMSVDVVWEIEREVMRLKTEETTTQVPAESQA